MAEAFLEEIYQEAKILCELKQIAEWVKVQDEHHSFMKFKEVVPELRNFCQRYLEIDVMKTKQLWNAVQDMAKVKSDLILLGDIVERRVIPLVEEYMKHWGKIELDNDEGDFRFETTVSGFLTIKNLQKNIYYHSTIDPMWEARRLAEYIFDPKKDSYSIWGCGLGYLPYQLYLISNGSVEINIFEKDARMIEYARDFGVLDWIPEDRLHVIVNDDVLPFLYSAEKENVGYYMFTPQFRIEEKEIHEVLDDIYIENSTLKKFGKYTAINFWRNIKSDSRMVQEFDTTRLSKDFVVIAAGPSLDDTLEFLKENQGKKTLVAVGTVFKKLLENDIVPDMVVVLDPQERTYKQIEGLEDQKVPMMIGMGAFWKFVAKYQGDKYLVPTAQGKEIKDYGVEHKWEFWACGGTVTSLAVECAIRFGAEKIYLVGVDLAYPNGVTHAAGTMDRTTKSLDNLIPVEGVGKQTVYTTLVFKQYRDGIETRIAQTPQIAYYNMSRVGIKIAGAMEVCGNGDDTDEREWNPISILERPQRFLYLSEQFTERDWERIWNETRALENDKDKLIIWMECLKHIGEGSQFEEYLALLQKTESLKWDEKYYLMWQIVGILFIKTDIHGAVVMPKVYQLYCEISQTFMQELGSMDEIQSENSNLVLITTQQFLKSTYMPTKAVLDCAQVLKRKLGKKVMIINTAEMYGGREVELLRRDIGAYIPEYLDWDTFEYEGEKYPFMQFEQNMPNLSSVREFLAFVQKYKPAYIVNIGGDSLLVDASTKLVPVLNINTVNAVARTHASQQAIGRALTQEDEQLLTFLGKNKEDVIEDRTEFADIIEVFEKKYLTESTGV